MAQKSMQDVLDTAVAHHRRGELDAAISLYSDVLAAAPDNAVTLHLLGTAYLRRRDVSGAVACFERVAVLQPHNAVNLEALGDALQRRADSAGAEAAYQRCRAAGGDAGKLAAKLDSIAFARQHLSAVPHFGFRADLWQHAFAQAPATGLVLEFGVADGLSLRHLASLAGQPIFGFDSFKGLPEDWQPGFAAGRFEQAALPADLPANAHLVVGRFEDTLPPFVAAHPGPVRVLHVDCDLYTSTRTVFEALDSRLVPGSVIVFDEFLNYPTWREHEYRAFEEFIARRGRRYEFIGWVVGGMQVAARLV